MKLIDKNAVLAILDKLIDELIILRGRDLTIYEIERIAAFEDAKTAIDHLKVKEVDLEKHLKEDIEDVFFDFNGVAAKGTTLYITVEDVKDIAKHFFELGLKAQKGE